GVISLDFEDEGRFPLQAKLAAQRDLRKLYQQEGGNLDIDQVPEAIKQRLGNIDSDDDGKVIKREIDQTTKPRQTTNQIGLAFLGLSKQAGGYLLPFEIGSVHWLVVLIGAFESRAGALYLLGISFVLLMAGILFVQFAASTFMPNDR
ncbi:MAG: hypothetical protein IH885_05625, partial [Myxococcales bacterium]|nr:hypothetical protein [Myxococcales bacterium]